MSDISTPYHRLPDPVRAVQVTRENIKEVADWCGGEAIHNVKPSDPKDVRLGVKVPTLDGVREANVGDYVVSRKNRYFPMRKVTFEERYAVSAESLNQ